MEAEPALPSDAKAIAEIHVDVWRATYKDLAPKAAFDALDVTLRLRQWQGVLDESASASGIFVLRDAGGVAGFTRAQYDPEGPMDGRGEIKHLYVAQARQSRGLGRILFAAAVQHLNSIGAPGVALGVVDGNARAIAFYERLGGRHVGKYIDPGPLWRSKNLIYAWA